MAKWPCRECGTVLNDRPETCPFCRTRHPTSIWWYAYRAFWINVAVFFGVLLLLGIVAVISGERFEVSALGSLLLAGVVRALGAAAFVWGVYYIYRVFLWLLFGKASTGQPAQTPEQRQRALDLAKAKRGRRRERWFRDAEAQPTSKNEF